MDIQSIIDNTKIVDKSKISTKYERDCRRFNQVRTDFCSTNRLKPKERELLYLLETRSECNNGDTKINNEVISQIIGRSRQAIDRYFKVLEDLGFITRLSVALTYVKHGTRKVWKDRVIRCRRIFLKNRFKPKTQEELKWKRDHRPPFDIFKAKDEATNQIISGVWLLPAGASIRHDGVEYLPKWECYLDLYQMGLLDPEQASMYERLKDLKEIDHENPEASLVLGKKCFF